VQIILAKPTLVDQNPEDHYEHRIPVVIFAINLFAALGQIVFQFPESGLLFDIRGLALNLHDDRVKLALQGQVECPSGDFLFSW
jgi:hypothetical protein